MNSMNAVPAPRDPIDEAMKRRVKPGPRDAGAERDASGASGKGPAADANGGDRASSAEPDRPGFDEAAVLAALEDVKDPEIPVVSVVELGIVQSVNVDGRDVTVTITPTFSGCPALEVMRDEIRARVLLLGADRVEVPVSLDPPWSSDRIAPAARERMKAIGLAPPPPAGRFQADESLLILGPSGGAGADGGQGSAEASGPSTEADPAVLCPFCGAEDTDVENAFGPTICRSLHYCRACQQPFEQFKAL